MSRALAAFAAEIDRTPDDEPSARAIVDTLRKTRLLKAPLSADAGGADLAEPARFQALFATLRSLGATSLSAARLFEGHVNAAMLVRLYGTPPQQEAFADRVADGALAGVWGADDADPLVATFSGDAIALRGGKALASGAGLAGAPIAITRTDDGPLMLLLDPVPEDRVDLTGWTPLGMVASATGRVDLTGLRLRRSQIIGREGDFLRQPHFSGGAWRFCAAHLGAAERLLDLFRAHLVARGRASDPYQMQRIAACTVATTTAAFWIGDAGRRLADPREEPARTVAFANLTRMVTERAALDVIEEVQRGIGLTGLLKPHPAERIMRDLATYLRQPVPDLAMADAARAVLASTRPSAELWT